jgi:hypothetical protein
MNAEQVTQVILGKYDDPSLRITIKAKDGQEVLMNAAEKMHIQLIMQWTERLFGYHDSTNIAAAAHDWDRAFPDIRVPFEDSPDLYWDYKIAHSANSARIFEQRFHDQIDAPLLKDITYLIKRHEIGGRKDTEGRLLFNKDEATHSFNLEEGAQAIQDADSISGFIAFLDKGPSIQARGDGYGLKKMGFYHGRASERAKSVIESLELTNPRLIQLFAQYKSGKIDEQKIDSKHIEEVFAKYA